MMIDMKALQIEFWLNGEYKEKKTKKLEEGQSYYPVV